MTELRTPQEWSDLTGIVIRNPDGWRTDGKSIDDPISRDEFEQRAIQSTISVARIRVGGLMRCCIESIRMYDGPMVNGATVIGCRHHDDPDKPVARLADDGVWEWLGG